MNCPQCQCELYEAQTFCHNCGEQVVQNEQERAEPSKNGTRVKSQFWPQAAILLTAMIATFFITFKMMDSSVDNGNRVSTESSRTEIVNGDRYAGKIHRAALLPYTVESGFPKLVAQFGTRLGEIEAFRRRAAEMALDSGKCDFVEISELSTKSNLDHLMFWVDCRNSQRIYLDEAQINGKSQILTQQDKSWTQADATTACSQAIKDSALIPGAVDIHNFLGTSFYKAPLTYNVVLKMDFDAQNAFGLATPYTATCHFEPGKVGTIDIQPR